MEREIVKRLNWYYYGIMLLAVIAAVVTYWLIMKDYVHPINPSSSIGMIIQYVVIFDALISIPVGLYYFRRQSLKIAKIEDATIQADAYVAAGKWRIIMVGNAMVLGIVAYYLLAGYQSMLWIAAIAAIGWYFTKPTIHKVTIELHASEEEQY